MSFSLRDTVFRDCPTSAETGALLNAASNTPALSGRAMIVRATLLASTGLAAIRRLGA